jgi:hypothetical protein
VRASGLAELAPPFPEKGWGRRDLATPGTGEARTCMT